MDRLLRMCAGTFLALMIVLLGIAPLAVPQYAVADVTGEGGGEYAAPPPPKCPSPTRDFCAPATGTTEFNCLTSDCQLGTTICGCIWDATKMECKCRE